MESVTALLGLGSNVGARDEHLRDGIGLLNQSLEVVGTSSVYETEPWGYSDQPPFLNTVCRVQTDVPPEDLLLLCQRVERRMGCKPTFRYGPRVLDVDILTYGDLVITTPGLVVPHARLVERAFVLVPLAEIAPEWRHPILGKSAAELLEEIQGPEWVRLWGGPLAIPSSQRSNIRYSGPRE